METQYMFLVYEDTPEWITVENNSPNFPQELMNWFIEILGEDNVRRELRGRTFMGPCFINGFEFRNTPEVAGKFEKEIRPKMTSIGNDRYVWTQSLSEASMI